jgi:hypothetical protein
VPLQPAHGGLPPHWHAPEVEQPFAIVGSHGVQAAPGAAQAETDSVVHIPVEQQPLVQDVESQAQLP